MADKIERVGLPDGVEVRVGGLAAVSSTSTSLPVGLLAGITALAEGAPLLVAALRHSADGGQVFTMAFSPSVQAGLNNGSFRIMQTLRGASLSTAVDRSGRIVGNGRLVDVVPAGQALSSVQVGFAAATLAASAATFVQQQQVMQLLERIEAGVGRIEHRLQDDDFGVCAAAERFLGTAAGAVRECSLPPVLQHELAQHRQAVAALHEARHRSFLRFRDELSHAQDERERKRGEAHPWVNVVGDWVENHHLMEELSLYLQTLLVNTKLDVVSAGLLAEQGAPDAARHQLEASLLRLRSRFFDLYNRLKPLARFEPEQKIWNRIPGVGADIERAHEQIKQLVAHIEEHDLPAIPEPEPLELIEITGSPDEARMILRAIELP